MYVTHNDKQSTNLELKKRKVRSTNGCHIPERIGHPEHSSHLRTLVMSTDVCYIWYRKSTTFGLCRKQMSRLQTLVTSQNISDIPNIGNRQTLIMTTEIVTSKNMCDISDISHVYKCVISKHQNLTNHELSKEKESGLLMSVTTRNEWDTPNIGHINKPWSCLQMPVTSKNICDLWLPRTSVDMTSSLCYITSSWLNSSLHHLLLLRHSLSLNLTQALLSSWIKLSPFKIVREHVNAYNTLSSNDYVMSFKINLKKKEKKHTSHWGVKHFWFWAKHTNISKQRFYCALNRSLSTWKAQLWVFAFLIYFFQCWFKKIC